MQRLWRNVQRVGLGAALFLGGVSAQGRAQAQAQSPDLTQGIVTELQSLAAGAGTIFVGQITSVERKGSVVEIAFRVEQPVAGATGAICVLREWAGLWPPGHSRYVVGQRALAFLRKSSAAGFSSPVHGAEGLVPVVVEGADAPRLLDVRRVAAAVVRNPNSPLPTEAGAALLLSDALEVISTQPDGIASAPVRVSLPVRGKAPVDHPGGTGRYPVVEPVPPQPRGPLKMPVGLGGVDAVR